MLASTQGFSRVRCSCVRHGREGWAHEISRPAMSASVHAAGEGEGPRGQHRLDDKWMTRVRMVLR